MKKSIYVLLATLMISFVAIVITVCIKLSTEEQVFAAVNCMVPVGGTIVYCVGESSACIIHNEGGIMYVLEEHLWAQMFQSLIKI